MNHTNEPLYKAPKPLTDEQIDDIYRKVWSDVAHRYRLNEFAREIEKAHGIKEQP